MLTPNAKKWLSNVLIARSRREQKLNKDSKFQLIKLLVNEIKSECKS